MEESSVRCTGVIGIRIAPDLVCFSRFWSLFLAHPTFFHSLLIQESLQRLSSFPTPLCDIIFCRNFRLSMQPSRATTYRCFLYVCYVHGSSTPVRQARKSQWKITAIFRQSVPDCLLQSARADVVAIFFATKPPALPAKMLPPSSGNVNHRSWSCVE